MRAIRLLEICSLIRLSLQLLPACCLNSHEDEGRAGGGGSLRAGMCWGEAESFKGDKCPQLKYLPRTLISGKLIFLGPIIFSLGADGEKNNFV